MSLFRKKSANQILAAVEAADADLETGGGLKRALGVRDLTALGIAAIVGAGIFSTIGEAAAAGGPAVSLLFIFTAVACGFSALCYAEFASALPIAGSAYTYSYVAFGELFAWIIGWDLIVEYAIGNIAVAISWSDYFTGLLAGWGLDLPAWLTMDYLSASRAFPEAQKLVTEGAAVSDLTRNMQEAFLAWQNAPQIGGLRFIADVPALAVVALITLLVYVGVKESRTTSNILVLLKLAVVVGVIVAGAFFVQPDNWSPFAPNGFSGVMSGVAAVFFAYIGFDAVSTTAEECKDPRRDLPRAIIYCLIICTILYILISFVLTGIVSYDRLAVGDPLAYVFTTEGVPEGLGNFIAGIVSVSAIIAMASVLLVFQMGQPRIWMSMSRDGLLPSRFSRIHPKYKTPGFATLVTGVLVGVPCLFMNLSEVTDLTSIGTLFAFVLVCGGVIRLQMKTEKDGYAPRFRVPYVSGKYIVPALFLATWAYLFAFEGAALARFFNLSATETQSTGALLAERFPKIVFILGATATAVLSFRYKFSLIPTLGLLSCFYLMSEVEHVSWFRFLAWLAAGLAIYFFFGRKNSKLAEGA